MTRPSPKPSSPRVAAHRRGKRSADGDRDSGSRRDKDSEADDNVLQEEASAGPSPPGSVPPTFDAFIAPTGTNRALAYHQDVSPTGMRPYAPAARRRDGLARRLVPDQRLSSGPIQHLGIEAAIEQAFGLRSAAGTDGSALAGRTFGNSVHDYAGGLRYRIPFGAGHQVWISGTAGEHAFVFTSPSDCSDCRAMLHIPDTVYRYGRPGIGLRLELPADLSLTLGGGYRYIFNAGGTHLDGYFPHRTVGGVDAELALGYRVTRQAWRSAARASCAATSTTCIRRPATPSSWVGRSISTGPSASGWRFCWAAAMLRAAPLETER